jgi:hypothetical protein
MAGLCWSGTVFARRGDVPVRLPVAPDSTRCAWFRLDPVLGLHDNSRRISPRLDPIRYEPVALDTAVDLVVAIDSPGTRTFARCALIDPHCPWSRSFESPAAMAARHPGDVFQVVVRGDDTYTGHLQELLGTPFVLIPRRLPEGHQTDLRLGSDCAALAAYGRRRLGEDIPYGGPRGLLAHLLPVVEGGMRAGDVLHYGEQVQVVFQDRGRIGFSDPDDLVIQSWHPWPRIVSRDSSGWEGRPFRVFRFRGDSAADPSRSFRNPSPPATPSSAPNRGRRRS